MNSFFFVLIQFCAIFQDNCDILRIINIIIIIYIIINIIIIQQKGLVTNAVVGCLESQVLQVQVAACEKQREDEKKLKEMEAEWLKEEARLRNEEEKWLQGEKLRKQKAAKRSREVSIRLKKEKEVCCKTLLPSHDYKLHCIKLLNITIS